MDIIRAERVDLAYKAEQALRVIGIVIRDKVITGLNIDEAMNHESIEPFVKELEEINAEIKAANARHAKTRLEHLRTELRAERISYAELAELKDLARYIEAGDVELLEAAGVPEYEA